jgi:hypothetical protein
MSSTPANGSPEKPRGPQDARVTQDPSAVIYAELLFVLLPLLVLLLAHGIRGEGFLRRVLFSADWSFAASVLFGQATVKFVSGITARPLHRPWARTALVVSSVIALLLTPSLVVLAAMLLLPAPPGWLATIQIVLFVLGIACYLIVGGAGQQLMEHNPADA